MTKTVAIVWVKEGFETLSRGHAAEQIFMGAGVIGVVDQYQNENGQQKSKPQLWPQKRFC